ncbi:hypothetical protein KAW65_07485 [candidate division WOR-3 bacterium]|nr:hypothetical protein [candidate division WOR-3 bacterium]
MGKRKPKRKSSRIKREKFSKHRRASDFIKIGSEKEEVLACQIVTIS